MANINATQLVPIDVAPGASAINYTPSSTICPILSLTCIGSSGSGNVKVTPYSAATLELGAGGSGGRLRIATNSNGVITTVEIASAGTGYTNGPVPVTISDPYGTGAQISCTASGGSISSVSIINGGENYSGYVTFDVSDFIEGVTYEVVPRYIEQTSGSGVLKLFGNRLSYRPYQVF
jgi:hypothetical protein